MVSLDGISIKDASGRSVDVGKAFAWMAQTCKPEIMYESYDLLTATLARFQAARDAFGKCETKGKRVDTAVFLHAFTLFYKTVHDYSTMPVADRVVNYQYLVKTLHRYHSGQDGLSQVFQDLGLADGTTDMGPEEFERVCDSYQAKVDAQLVQFIIDAEKNVVEKKILLEEADRALQTAKGSKDPLKWNNLAQKMEERVSTLAQEALDKVMTTGKPAWFIDETTVTYDAKPFASGAFGSVHHGNMGGHDDKSGAKVVVKRLLSLSDGMKKMFDKEVDLWAQLMHPYVLRLFGACPTSALPLMVCELAKHGNLVDYLATAKGKSRAWRLLYQIAVAIAFLHDKSIIHADLKLNNFLVGDDGYARVTDFGMSRFKVSSNVYATSSADAEQLAVGALRWRAPECIGKHRVSAQMPSDVYSFGMCLYEAFHGFAPYDYLDDVSVAAQIVKGKLPERPKQIPETAWDLVKSMTSMEPMDRPTIQQVVRELWVFAEEEEKNDEDIKKELKLICSSCHAETLPTGCPSCGSKKSSKLFKIESKADLPRVMELLLSQSKTQKLNAMQALQSYISQDLAQQQEVYDARAISVLSRIVKQTDEEEVVQREAIVTLACVVIGNEVAQNLVRDEKSITRLVQILRAGPDGLKNKAANSLGYISYRNDSLFKAITDEANLLDLINALTEESPDKRRDKARALKMLGTQPVAPVRPAVGA